MKNWRGDSTKVKRSKKKVAPLNGLLVNIALHMEVKELEEIAALCISDFQSDADSRAGWEMMHADWVAVYNQNDSPVNRPWTDSSDESIGLLTESCNSFQARAYKAFFPSRNPIAALAVGKQSEALQDRAKRVAKYLQWSLFTKDQTYKEEKNAMLLRVAIHGSDFSKTHFDPVLNKIVVRPVRAMDLYVPYSAGPMNIEDVPRKTELMQIALNDGRIRAKAGYFLAPVEPLVAGARRRPVQEQSDSDIGIQPSSSSESDDFGEVIEQHRDLDLDQDGIAEPYKVWVDLTAERVLRIEVRYEVDDLGRATNGRLPIEEYTHYRFLVNPDGFYGYGLGFLIGKTNIAVNKMLRQYVDATTLAIHGNLSGFISDELNISKGAVKLELGSFKTVSASAEMIQKGIKTMDFKYPGEGLMKAMGQLEARAQRLGSATDVLAGDIDKVMQPTTVQTMVEQGLMLFTAVQEFLLNSWSKELNKVYRLNSMYFRGEDWFVNVTPNGLEDSFIKEEDFRDDMMIMPVADPRLSSQQARSQRAQFLYDFSLKNPLIASDPAILLRVSRLLLREMDFDEVDQILPSDPKQLKPPTPDPKLQIEQMKQQGEQQRMQMESQNLQAQQQLAQTQAQTDATIAQAKVGSDAQLDQTKLQNEQQLATMRLQGEQQIASLKLQSERQLATEKMKFERELALEKLGWERELDKMKLASQERIGMAQAKAAAKAKTKAAA